MPLRPATFNPYPAQDRRAAARERYYRALEEARRAKEAYADALDGDEDEDCDPKPADDKSSPPPPVPVSKARAERRQESDNAAASASTSASTSATASVSSPARPSSPADARKFASAGGGTSAFQQWFQANMGVPSPFTAAEPPPTPAQQPRDSLTSVNSVIRPHMVQEHTLFDSSDRERRRAALTVAELSSPEPALEPTPSPTGETLGLFQPPEFTTVPLPQSKHTQAQEQPTAAPEYRPAPSPPRPAERPLPAPAPASCPVPQQSALAALASAAAVTLAVPVPPRPSPPVPATPTPDLALAPVEAPAPKPKLPSPTPQHIPIFTECAPPPHDRPVDPLAEIRRLATTFEQIRKAFVFPAVLDFSSAAAAPPAKEDVKLPVCARNLPVHAYEHALQKILTRLESVTAARAKGVRDARKKAVADVKGEMERIRAEVQRRARER